MPIYRHPEVGQSSTTTTSRPGYINYVLAQSVHSYADERTDRIELDGPLHCSIMVWTILEPFQNHSN